MHVEQGVVYDCAGTAFTDFAIYSLPHVEM